MKKCLSIFYCLFFITVCGCSTLFKVTSEPPEAEVFVVTGEKKEKKLLGKTPLEMPVEELTKSLNGEIKPGEFFTVEVSKSGFLPQSFQLPANRFGTSVTQLTVNFTKGESDKEMKTAQDILNRLFLAQKLAVNKQYERALIELDRILTQFPTFPRALSMKGTIYMAQQNYPESLKWYEEALKNDPQMDETIKLATKVRELMGQRMPATKR